MTTPTTTTPRSKASSTAASNTMYSFTEKKRIRKDFGKRG